MVVEVLRNKLNVKNLALIRKFLGMHFEEMPGKSIFISQGNYITDIVKKYLQVDESCPFRVPALVVRRSDQPLDTAVFTKVIYKNPVEALFYLN